MLGLKLAASNTKRQLRGQIIYLKATAKSKLEKKRFQIEYENVNSIKTKHISILDLPNLRGSEQRYKKKP